MGSCAYAPSHPAKVCVCVSFPRHSVRTHPSHHAPSQLRGLLGLLRVARLRSVLSPSGRVGGVQGKLQQGGKRADGKEDDLQLKLESAQASSAPCAGSKAAAVAQASSQRRGWSPKTSLCLHKQAQHRVRRFQRCSSGTGKHSYSVEDGLQRQASVCTSSAAAVSQANTSKQRSTRSLSREFPGQCKQASTRPLKGERIMASKDIIESVQTGSIALFFFFSVLGELVAAQASS
eukprot:1139476-Pelagomonas_calceolata.AAC.1